MNPSWSEDVARRSRRVAGTLRAARNGCSPDGPSSVVLTLHEALMVAHDLYMLDLLSEPPSLRWDAAAANSALARWRVQVPTDQEPDT